MTGSGSRAEVLTGPERRRRWSVEQKLAIVAELARSGSSGAVVARRYGISTGLLYTWRRQAQGLRSRPMVPGFMPVVIGPKVDAVTAPDEASEVFAPVVVSGRSEGAGMSAGGVMEIELPGGRRLRVDRHVDAEALRRVLAVLGR
jgi:transposase